MITVLNFDDTLIPQTRYYCLPFRVIECKEIRGTKLFCEERSLLLLTRLLQNREKDRVVLIGCADYHYVSYILLAEMVQPFTLVLFDHHADLRQSPERTLLSCGSWVARAAELQYLVKIVIIGARPDSFLGADCRALQKVLYAPYSPGNLETAALPESIAPIEEQGIASVIREVIEKIPTDDVYISIDKDVLCKEDALTNWDQGEMTLQELLVALRSLASSKQICGVDLCGEEVLHPLDWMRAKGQEVIRKNAVANMQICSLFC